MARTIHRSRSPAAALLLLLLAAVASSTTTDSSRAREAHVEPADGDGYRTYIVLLEPPPGGLDADALRAWHQSFLPSVTTARGKPRLEYSYRTVFDGFAARLTEDELKQVSAKPGFLRSFPNIIGYLQTTRTPAFLGLPNRMGESPDNWPGAGGRGMIIGVVDGGIDSYHPSLEDTGFDDNVPPHWNGWCFHGLRCNKKLIGLRDMYDPGYPPVDVDNGHGTHVATTAAGNFVANVSINGLARGDASGVAPYAHLAIYKACGGEKGRDCPVKAVLSAIDQAVEDGVDVLSLSMSFGGATFDHDPIAIGSFDAMRRGVLVVAAAGNNGPGLSSVKNVAPWILTVGASTVDRSFPTSVYLNGEADHARGIAEGQSLADRMKMLEPEQPQWGRLLYGRSEFEKFCYYEVDEMEKLFPGRLVLCDPIRGGREIAYKIVTLAIFYNATGVVLIQPQVAGKTMSLDNFGPNRRVIQVPYDQGEILKNFSAGPLRYGHINFGEGSLGTQVPFSPAPVVAFFSGRGPSKLVPAILKPDVLAPGVNILAGVPSDGKPYRNFAFNSGTSMATPHVSGLVALLKKAHPTWSPAIIKSALMTTADFNDNTERRIQDEQELEAGHYAIGAGHVNVTRAMDPGLAYDIDHAQYTGFLCTSLGQEAMRLVSRNKNGNCNGYQVIHQDFLNYPSVIVNVVQQKHQQEVEKLVYPPGTMFVPRTLTNLVADGLPEMYTVAVDMSEMLFVEVYPDVLSFTSLGDKQTYFIRASARHTFTLAEGAVFEGSLTWSSNSGHIVRSPLIAVVGLGYPQQSTAWKMD